MIKITYCKDGTNNWGDYVAPILVEYISGQKTQFIISEGYTEEDDVYAVVGSILSWQQKPNLTVWGAGLMCDGQSMLVKPKKVCAVRGPLTRNLLIKQGIECPEIYGDPALLLPRYYNPDIKKKYKLGIIPHYVDKNSNWIKSIQNDDIKIIDICSDTYSFVDSLKECEKVVSSSLHGIIAADSYGIPNMWIKMSDKVGGHGFKFDDYFLSVNRKTKCVNIFDETDLNFVINEIPDYEMDINLDLLYDSCPFTPSKLKQSIN
jgi:pyruvyltransferase